MKTDRARSRSYRGRVYGAVRTLPGFRRYPLLYVSSAVRARQHHTDLATVQTFLLFIGHDRSGHSLVGSLLDAHPAVVISHELDALKYVAAGYRRSQLLTLVLERSRANAAAGRESWGYSYAVSGQWQGRFDRLLVVGDKRGRGATARLAERPELLEMLAATVQLPISIVQVTRDPRDNIATVWRRGRHPLSRQVEHYFSVCATVDDIVARVDPARLHRVRLEQLIANPQQQLAELCRFLDVDAGPGYLDACASIVFDAPRRTRGDAPWTPELIEEVDRSARRHAFLAPYVGEEPVGDR